MAKAKKETRIKQEQQKLLQIFAGCDPNKLGVARSLIDRIAFITVSLQDLEEDLNRYGWTEIYTNGANQEGVKKSAAAECHVSLTKNLNALTKQLMDIVPAAQRASKLNELMNR